jgi:large subunit ribosomal protein L10e
MHVLRINKMLTCAGADRLQTGMRHAFGKPCGTVARVRIGQIIYSVRSKFSKQAHVIEALRRSKYKFPGRQNIVISKKFGFCDMTHKQFKHAKKHGLYKHQGVHVELKRGKGPINKDSVMYIGKDPVPVVR